MSYFSVLLMIMQANNFVEARVSKEHQQYISVVSMLLEIETVFLAS